MDEWLTCPDDGLSGWECGFEDAPMAPVGKTLLRDDEAWFRYRLNLGIGTCHVGCPPSFPCYVLTHEETESLGERCWYHEFVTVEDARRLLEAERDE